MSKKIPWLLFGAALAWLCPGAFADDTGFSVKITQQSLDPLPPAMFVRVACQQTRVVFLAPHGFKCTSHEERREVRLVARNDTSAIALTFHTAELTETNAAPYWRAQLLGRYAGAQVVEHFTESAAGASGPAFDLVWERRDSPPLKLRSMFIPLGKQWVELTLITTPAAFEQDRHALNQVALSLRAAEGVEAVAPVLSNKI